MGLKLLDSGAGLEPRAALSASFKAAAAHVRSSAGGALLSRGDPQRGPRHLRKFCQEYKHKSDSELSGYICIHLGKWQGEGGWVGGDGSALETNRSSIESMRWVEFTIIGWR